MYFFKFLPLNFILIISMFLLFSAPNLCNPQD